MKTETKIGIVGILSITILVWGINFLKGKNLFDKYNTYYAKYSNIGGLLPTSYVFVNGMKVGKVTKITSMDKELKNFLVSFDIPASINIPTNSVAEVYSSDILGSKAMRILMGDATTYLSENDTLKSSTGESMLSEIENILNPYTTRIDNIISNLDNFASSINNVLDYASQQEIKNIISNANQASASLASLSNNLDKITSQEKEKIHSIVTNIENISKTLEENDDKLAKAIENFANMSDTLVNADISSIINEVSSSLETLSNTLGKINSGKGNLGLLINDENLYLNLERASKNLDSLIFDIKNNPKRYLNVSIF